LREEYFNEDAKRVAKRSFLDWVEQQPGIYMDPNELLREFEKKYNQLPLVERCLLDPRKAELFLHTVHDDLEDRLLLVLRDMNTEGGFTNNWRRMEETLILVAKQQCVRARGIVTRSDVGPILAPKTPAVVPSIFGINKVVPEDIVEDLIKDFKELKVKMSALRRNNGPNTSRPMEGL
jgi:hypothetical protein